MIYYDSHRWYTLCKLRGSVLQKACVFAIPPTLGSFLLKYFEVTGWISLRDLAVLTSGDIYSGFQYVLGFLLVFRTSQSYSRYWSAATAVHEMSSEWCDACSSLVAFPSMSLAPIEEVMEFRHTIVRLFSLLHAMAMSEITSIDEDLPLLDVKGLSKQQLHFLTSGAAQGRKADVVISWVKAYIIKVSDEGLLNVPSPILAHVFQELGVGMVNFHRAQQVVIWPFPFPYTQLTVILLLVYSLITPVVISTWDSSPAICALFTFISVTCMMGLDFIASELENPFGDDPNDLPVVELQEAFNQVMINQVDPIIVSPPELTEAAELDHSQLECSGIGQMTLEARLKMASATFTRSVLESESEWASGGTEGSGGARRRRKGRLQWSKSSQKVPDSPDQPSSLHRWLGCTASDASPDPETTKEPEDGFAPVTPDPELTSCADVEAQSSPRERQKPLSMPPAESKPQRRSQRFRPSAGGTASRDTGGWSTGAGWAAGRENWSMGRDRGGAPAAAWGPGGGGLGLEESPSFGPTMGSSACASDRPPPQGEWGEFLSCLHKELQEHLQNCLQVQRQELRERERLLIMAAWNGVLEEPQSCQTQRDSLSRAVTPEQEPRPMPATPCPLLLDRPDRGLPQWPQKHKR